MFLPDPVDFQTLHAAHLSNIYSNSQIDMTGLDDHFRNVFCDTRNLTRVWPNAYHGPAAAAMDASFHMQLGPWHTQPWPWFQAGKLYHGTSWQATCLELRF